MFRGLLLDLDGTVYRGREAIPGATDFLTRLRRVGLACLYLTNRSSRTPVTICRQLRGYGLPCTPRDILTSAEATAHYLGSGRVWMIGEVGLRTALRQAGLEMTAEQPDTVVVGIDRRFSYAKLTLATRLIQGGARFVATNPDRVLETETGLVPGNGALVAAVATATGVEPLVIGKPNRGIFDVALERLGCKADEVVVVGDNLETDILGGQAAGLATVLILTGVSQRQDVARLGIQPTWVIEDYRQLAELIFAGRGPA